MNQDRAFSPTIIDLSNEYRILVEDINDFSTSFFKNVYKQALNHVKEIVETNDIYRKKLKDETNHYIIDGLPDVYNNIIVFEGERGKGKSSAMLSFRKALVENRCTDHKHPFFNGSDNALDDKYNFVAFDVIDPSFFNGDETLFEIIVAKLFHQFEQKLKNSGSNIMDDKRRELISSFQQVFEDIKNQNNKSNVYNGDALDALIKLSTSSNLRKSFSQLLKQYLDVFGDKEKSNYLVLTIDDFDLNISGMYKMMEDIRRFLINENIIILMSCKLSQVQEATYLEFYNILFSKVSNIQVLDNIIPREEITHKGNKHIQKLIPSNRVNKLNDLAIDYYNFEVNDTSRFLTPFSLILLDPNNKKTQIKQEIDSLKDLTLNDVKNLEKKYYPSLIIGENFQRAFFKYFYLRNDLFICNRKDYIYGLVPHTFRDLYDIKKQIKGDNFEDYIKDLLLNKINLKRIEIKQDTLNIENSFLLFYSFLSRSINFLENNDLALFNNYFISNITTINNIFRPTNGMGLEKLNDYLFQPGSIPNSWIYSILYGIKDNNRQFDQNLEQILDLYILFFFLKNKEYISERENKNRLFSSTNNAYFRINRRDTKSEIESYKSYYTFSLSKVTTTKLNNEFQNNFNLDNSLLFFIHNLISNTTNSNQNNTIIPYRIPNYLSFDFKLPDICDLEITKIFQPDFDVYQVLKNQNILINYKHIFIEWFNPSKENTKLYVNLFYNPIFFDLFITKLKKHDKTLSYKEIFFNLESNIESTLTQIKKIYPYLNLETQELYQINPLLKFCKDHQKLIEDFLTKVQNENKNNIDYDDFILEILGDSLTTDKENKRITINYLLAWPNKSRSNTVINNLETKLVNYLQNSLCTTEQKKLIESLLLFIRQEIINRNSKHVKLSAGLINSIDNQVAEILNSLQNG